MKDVILLAVVVLVEIILLVALRIESKARRARMEGTPTISPPIHVALGLPLVLMAAAGDYWFIRQADWLSLAMQLCAMGTVGLTLRMHARRVVIQCVPAAQVATWMQELSTPLGLRGNRVRISDKWQESRAVLIEIPSGSRDDLLALVAALRPRVQDYPVCGPWQDASLSTKIVPPVLVAIMVLLPLALLLARAGI